ncbi:hypothetical protein [Xanthovirga aplysinae]|uniref:hypothetical protein n=1 Tax=Xanthovirga aplysinae TaxID=2529853 RepID=UPI0012BCC78A|nr:hypothetical protein [Xanthovirga aplysinae]MTI32353.1 hypothetical protein [Xanthovirga aplysinae]
MKSYFLLLKAKFKKYRSLLSPLVFGILLVPLCYMVILDSHSSSTPERIGKITTFHPLQAVPFISKEVEKFKKLADTHLNYRWFLEELGVEKNMYSFFENEIDADNHLAYTETSSAFSDKVQTKPNLLENESRRRKSQNKEGSFSQMVWEETDEEMAQSDFMDCLNMKDLRIFKFDFYLEGLLRFIFK